ncbi:MAG: patatin-like phospholipase family protein [Bosea sp. (in: a-proteobacteria)]
MFEAAPPASPALQRPKLERPKLGLALGGGAARGWAHIGVLQVLDEAGIKIDILAGTSIGSVVGGCHAGGKLAELETFERSLTKRRVIGLMDFHIGGSGLISGGRLKRLLDRDLGSTRIEQLPHRYVAIATELGSGHEIWLTEGSVVEAMRASYALPGVFDPVRLGGRWLMDGALVNPVPVTAARALGADVVVCVNLNGEGGGRGTTIQSHAAVPDPEGEVIEEAENAAGRGWFAPVRGVANRLRALAGEKRETPAPGLAGVIVDAFNITQDRISRSRLAGDPPDVMIGPKLARVGLFDFHRADETIELGRAAALRALDDIRATLAASVHEAV